jgi:hypothetical protein
MYSCRAMKSGHTRHQSGKGVYARPAEPIAQRIFSVLTGVSLVLAQLPFTLL